MHNTTEIIKLKREKLQKIIEMGINPYHNRVERTHQIKELQQKRENLLQSQEEITIAGRLTALRRHGKIGFANIEDMSGKIQLYVRLDTIGEADYEIYKHCDLGDFIQTRGVAIITERGEYSLKCLTLKLLSKNLRPIPTVKEKVIDGKTVRYDEFSDIELRYRKRYLDLLLNPDNKATFITRANIIRFMREYLDNHDFIEVETPVLQPLYGGAYARPFITHHNTLDIDLYLRIATELYLKRLIIGGFEKVYEIGKDFRNEGMDRNHNPEFTMLEVYQSYADYHTMMDLTEDMITTIAKKLFNSTSFQYDNHTISLQKPWARGSMIDLIKKETGLDTSDCDLAKLTSFFKEHNLEIPEKATAGELIIELFEIYIEKNLIQPTFIIDFPKEVSPLAKSRVDNPHFVERFELFIAGHELGNAFTELNDPIEQERRLQKQAAMREAGDMEAAPFDEDFLEAMEYGMPPTGGLGIGVDRLCMLFTNNSSIKEVILFPQMKPEHHI
ncbi:MAG: lysine--tRNA ligase [Candidatus Cloacimonetes bacterium]|nr:lysine--tRNA ligase [Candidatus Cloacimonadota bacterium]